MIKYVHKLKTIKILAIIIGVALALALCPASQVLASGTTSTTGNAGTTTTTEDSAVGSRTNGLPRVDGLTLTYNNDGGTASAPLKVLMFLTLIALSPSLLIMLTSFTRIIVVMHFTRQALGTQTAPPNQVLIGLSLFLTFFIMAPVFGKINDNAIKPFDAGEIQQEEFFTRAMDPLKEFMYGQTQTKDLNLFLEIAEITEVNDPMKDIPVTVLIPGFILSELRQAFIIGFLIYIPFIVIDMVVASTLMSMGMMMLPPTTISMPFKILLFVLADGWDLVIGNLVKTFY